MYNGGHWNDEDLDPINHRDREPLQGERLDTVKDDPKKTAPEREHPETAVPDIYLVDPETGENRPLSGPSILDAAANDESLPI